MGVGNETPSATPHPSGETMKTYPNNSRDIPSVRARDVAHADELNRRITDWQEKLRRIYPTTSESEILRLACCYVSEEERGEVVK